MKFIFSLFLFVGLLFSAPTATHAIDLFDAGMIDTKVSVQTVAPTTISFSYQGLEPGTKIFLVSHYDQKDAYELKLQKNAPTAGQITQSIPSKVLKSKYSSLYRLEARDSKGSVLAYSEGVQTGRRNKEAPNCKIESNKYVVSVGESFTISWSGTNAEHTVLVNGFANLEGDKQYPTQGKNKLISNLRGTHKYTILFQGASGNQAFCDVFVYVIGPESSGTIDRSSLTSSSLKPILTGTAHNTKKVVISITDQEKDGGFWMSKPTTVKDGRWSIRVTRALQFSNYEYNVNLSAFDKGQYADLSTNNTLTIE